MTTCKQCGMDGGRHKLQCSYRGNDRLVLPAVKVAHRDRDCSGMRFEAMRPAGKRDADGVQRVACDGYAKGGE